MEDIFMQVPKGLYWAFVFFSSFIENVFPPYPGDTATVFGAYLAGKGYITLYSLILSVYLGSILGALFMYFLGTEVLKFFSKYVRFKSIRELLSEEHLTKTHDWFEKYGLWAVIFSRFSAGIRFFVAIVAGMVKMNILTFTIAFSIGTILWNALLITGGYMLGENWQQVKEYLKIYNIVIGILLAIVAFGIY
ncbi:MAG: DedA family protein, partial [Candidatus Hydrogenedentota bacterium]